MDKRKNSKNGYRQAAFVVLFLAAFGVGAETSPEQPHQDFQKPVLPPMIQDWLPQPPAEDEEWDWVQLTSGEWLKGYIRALENDVLEFDSDKLNLLKLDWDDVKFVRTARPMAVMYGNQSIAVGFLTTDSGQLFIIGPNIRVPFPQVVSMAMGTPNERDLWTGDASVSLNLRTGNVEQTDITTSIKLQRRTAKTSFRLSYLANYTEFDAVENANDHRASMSYDYRINKDWFWRPVSLEYYRDPYQNIDAQWTYGFGAGLYLLDTKATTWVVAVSPGYQTIQYTDVAAGDDDKTSSGVLILSTQSDQELTADLDLKSLYQVVLSSSENGRAKHHAELMLDVDMTDKLDLQLGLYWDRVENPQPDELGVVPQKDDFRMAVGLNYEL